MLGPVIDDLPTPALATAQTAPLASRAVSVTQKVRPPQVDQTAAVSASAVFAIVVSAIAACAAAILATGTR